MAGNIFINYRRDDDAGFTQALYSRLEQAFPSESLFMDVDNIAPGLDFVQVLNDEVARCDVVIAVIGKNWLSVTDETGGRRLDNPEDFVRIEIKSALAQKKRVIPVLVNDARMPRSTELPETMRAFARCNAARLTHERFRADMAGLIKSLEQILAEIEAARQAEDEAARSEAKAKEKEEAERLRRERLEARKRREGKPAELSRAKTEPREPPLGVVSWIAGLPSEISWRVPIAMVVIGLLGWFLPGKIFMTRDGLGWGIWSLLYGLVGLIVVGAVFYVRRKSLAGAELALYWFAAMSFLACVSISIISALDLTRTINANLPVGALATLTAASFIAIRRNWISGLEIAVYWAGFVLFLFWGTIPLVAEPAAASALGSYFSDNAGYRAAGILLSGVVVLSAALILLIRNRRLSGPEAAVYLIGAAYMISVGIRLA